MTSYTDNPMMRASLGVPHKALLAAYLTCVEPDSNHRKFYQIYVIKGDKSFLSSGSDWLVVCKWGRIGTDGQSKTHTLHKQSAATSKAETLIRQKLSRGYVDGFEGMAQGMAQQPVIAAAPEFTAEEMGRKPGFRKIVIRKRDFE